MHLPSANLTPLPSPLVTAGQFPSTLSLEGLALGSSPRRKGYGVLGMGLPPRGIATADPGKRNVSEFPAPRDGEGGFERSVSMSRTGTDDGLRREEVILRRQRSFNVDPEVYVSPPPTLGFLRGRLLTIRIWNIGVQKMMSGNTLPHSTLNQNPSEEEHSPKSSSPLPSTTQSPPPPRWTNSSQSK